MKILKHNDYHFIRSSIGTFSSNISNINKTNTNTLVLNNNIPITGEDDKCVLFYDNTTKKLKAFVDNNEVEISFGNGGGGGDVPDYVLKYNHLNNTIEYEEDGIWKTLEFIENMREQIDELGWVNEKIIYDPINNIIQIKEVDNTIIESDLKINKNVIIGEDVTPTGDDSIMLHVGKNQPKTSINIDNYDGSSSFKMFGDNNLYEMTTDVNGLVFKNNDVEKLVIGNNYVGVNANTAITGFLNVGELITPTTDSIATINCSNDRNKINILNSYDEDVVINLNSSNSSSNNSNYSLYSKKNGDFELYNEKISKSILKVNDINSKISGHLGINIEPSNNSLDVDGTTRLRGAVTMDSTLTVDDDVNVTGTLHGYKVYSTMNTTPSVLASISQFLGTSQYSRFIIDNIRAGHTILRMRSYYDTPTNNKRGDWGLVLDKDNGEFQLHRYTSDAISTIPLRINQDDNIGIGTAPTEGVKLDVNGDTMIRGDVTIDGAITTTKVNVMNGTTTAPSIATISYFSGTGSNNERVVIDNTSGGNAALRLRSIDDDNIKGDFGFAVNANGTAGIYKYDGAHSGSYAFLINNTGNMGIGTQNPTSKLDVNGDVRVRGDLIVDGDFPCLGGGDGVFDSLNVNGQSRLGGDVAIEGAPGDYTRFNIKSYDGATGDVATNWRIYTRPTRDALIFRKEGSTQAIMNIHENGVVIGNGENASSSQLWVTGNGTIWGHLRSWTLSVNDMTGIMPPEATVAHFGGKGTDASVVMDNTEGGKSTLRLRSMTAPTDGTATGDFAWRVNNNDTMELYKHSSTSDGGHAGQVILIDRRRGMTVDGKVRAGFGSYDGEAGYFDGTVYVKSDLKSDSNITTMSYLWTHGPSTTGWIEREVSGRLVVNTSDIRLKSNIKRLKEQVPSSLDVIKQVETYTFKHERKPERDSVVGFIADQLMLAIPDAVDGKKYEYEFEYETDEDGKRKIKLDDEGKPVMTDKPRYKSLDMVPVIAHLVEAVKELTYEVQVLKEQMYVLKHKT